MLSVLVQRYSISAASLFLFLNATTVLHVGEDVPLICLCFINLHVFACVAVG